MFLDIGAGLMLGILVGILTNNNSMLLVILGGLAALAPDLDFLIYLYKKNFKTDEFSHEHRDLFHKPILFSLGGGLIFLFFSPTLSLLWFLGTIFHFVHDTMHHGWGIKWGYPFDKRYFIFSSRVPKKIIQTKEEQRELAIKYGNSEWLKEGYLRINRGLILELIVLAIGILIAIWWIK